MFPQNQKEQSLTWKQKAETAAWFMSFPALTLMVFLRRHIGFRQLQPAGLFVMAAILIVFAQYADNSSSGVFGSSSSAASETDVPPGFDAAPPADWQTMTYQARQEWQNKHRLTPEQQRQAEARAESWADFRRALVRWPLMIFAIVMFAWGIVQRRQRWNDIKSGVRLHTYSRGIPWLARFLPLSQNAVQRFADPAICFLLGVILLRVSHPLAIWLLFSAMALFLVEQYVYEKQLERHLDMLDGLVESEVQGENLKHFEGPQPEQKERSLEQTAGIPTGIAPELEMQIARRKKRQMPPDDLASP